MVFQSETFLILSNIPNYWVLMELKVLFQSPIEPGVPTKFWTGVSAKEYCSKFFQNFFANNVFCKNFLEFCTLTYYEFGTLALKSTSLKQCLAWCTKWLLFLILHSSFFVFLFSCENFTPRNKRSKIRLLLICFSEFFKCRGKKYFSRLNSRAYLNIGSICSEKHRRVLSVPFGRRKSPPSWLYHGKSLIVFPQHPNLVI